MIRTAFQRLRDQLVTTLSGYLKTSQTLGKLNKNSFRSHGYRLYFLYLTLHEQKKSNSNKSYYRLQLLLLHFLRLVQNTYLLTKRKLHNSEIKN